MNKTAFIVVDMLNDFLEENGKVYPVEIKTSANPTTAMVKNFSILEKYNLSMGEGAVICLVPTYLPLTKNIHSIPAYYV